MNEHFRAFVATSRRLAEARGLEWSLPCDHVGKVPADRRWNLTRLVGMVPPPVIALTHVGYD
uniref:hypothetical protein n=1 Tax=Klebsiella pneumoniae TaxID=573 RepID=UPI001952D732